LRFDVLQQSARTNHFEMVEIWNSPEAQDAHEISPGNRDFRAKLAPLLGALYDQRVYRPL
jgi:quinol monooxygenase YgiN